MFQQAEKPRYQRRLPQGSFVQADQWMNYLGYEQYCWWLKFHSWVDRRKERVYEQHVPYTLESVFEKLGVSQATFYRKIKVLWECGLIEIIEFGKSERKTQKPKNIIVYEYPFNNAEYEYLELEKRRDWVKDYASESVLAGIRGAIKRHNQAPLNSDRVEKPVDNSVDNSTVDNVDKVEANPLNSDRVYPLNSDRVTLSNVIANNVSNNYTHVSNKPINDSNNSLSQAKIDLIREILISFEFTEGERGRIVELLLNKGLYSKITKTDLLKQAQYTVSRDDIRDRAIFFVTGIERNIGREYPKPRPKKEDEPNSGRVPFYNWLEQ